MDWSHVEFGSVAPYLGTLLIMGGALAGSFLPAEAKRSLERRVLLPGALVVTLAAAAWFAFGKHDPLWAGGFALVAALAAWRLFRRPPQPNVDPSRRR